jgi:hypothetical protein
MTVSTYINMLASSIMCFTSDVKFFFVRHVENIQQQNGALKLYVIKETYCHRCRLKRLIG